ncbi:MAG: hypothetical protein ACRDBY_13470 [Cetobacterium sp.]
MKLIKRIFKSLMCRHNYKMTGSMIIDGGRKKMFFSKCENCGKTKTELL